MRLHTLLVGLGLAVAALLVALVVILPIFYIVNLIYDDGRGLTPLLITVVLAWAALAWLLARRRISL